MRKQCVLLEKLRYFKVNTEQIPTLILFFSNTLGMLINLLYSSPSPWHTHQGDGGVAPKIFETYISTYILGRTMKLSIQALQRYIILPKNS